MMDWLDVPGVARTSMDGIAVTIWTPPMAARGTLFWVHGYTLNASIWQILWQKLPEWRHVGIDLPGHGVSDPLEPTERLPALAQRVGNIAVECGAWHLIGLSFGGMIALQVAIEFPDQFSTLTLAASGLGGGPLDPDASQCNMDLRALYQQRGAGPWMTQRWMQAPPDIFAGAARIPTLYAALAQVVDQHRWQELSGNVMQNLCFHPQPAADLARITAATRLLIGEQDMAVFKRCGQLIQRAVPDCQRSYMNNAGHLCLLEDPDSAAQLIEQHLTANGF